MIGASKTRQGLVELDDMALYAHHFANKLFLRAYGYEYAMENVSSEEQKKIDGIIKELGL